MKLGSLKENVCIYVVLLLSAVMKLKLGEILGWGEDWCIKRGREMQANGKRLYYLFSHCQIVKATSGYYK